MYTGIVLTCNIRNGSNLDPNNENISSAAFHESPCSHDTHCSMSHRHCVYRRRLLQEASLHAPRRACESGACVCQRSDPCRACDPMGASCAAWRVSSNAGGDVQRFRRTCALKARNTVPGSVISCPKDLIAGGWTVRCLPENKVQEIFVHQITLRILWG